VKYSKTSIDLSSGPKRPILRWTTSKAKNFHSFKTLVGNPQESHPKRLAEALYTSSPECAADLAR